MEHFIAYTPHMANIIPKDAETEILEAGKGQKMRELVRSFSINISII